MQFLAWATIFPAKMQRGLLLQGKKRNWTKLGVFATTQIQETLL